MISLLTYFAEIKFVKIHVLFKKNKVRKTFSTSNMVATVVSRAVCVGRPSPPRMVRVDCMSAEVAEVFWYSGPSNNDPISEFVIYSRDWSPDAERPPPFSRSALNVGGRHRLQRDAR